jgi:hypothetical protein
MPPATPTPPIISLMTPRTLVPVALSRGNKQLRECAKTAAMALSLQNTWPCAATSFKSAVSKHVDVQKL